MKKTIYVDNAATTPTLKPVLDAMIPFFCEHYGNPSAMYGVAGEAKEALEEARRRVAALIGADEDEIFFTGGGTEADNLALRGVMCAPKNTRKHMITTEIEHHAILHPAQQLEREGFRVTYMPVDDKGRVSLSAIADEATPDTALISVMAANNEVGTIEPIAEIGAFCRGRGIIFHTDAVQAAGHMKIDVHEMKIDLLSMSAHKFGGPKGVGAIYIRRGIRLLPLVLGGGQEKGMRSGTENTAGIVGMGMAAKIAAENMEEDMKRVAALRDKLIKGVLEIKKTRLTGDPENRLPGTASFVIEGVEGESMVLLLNEEGICAATGSACSTASLDPSHVLTAMHIPHEIVHGSLRISIGVQNTESDIDHIIAKLPGIVARLRAMSPMWNEEI